jgi:prepilin-type N-terminal cleavage/methylation domain-containing protein
MPDRRDDAGFTLIELMISIVLLGIIIVPLTNAMISGLRITTEAQQRLSETRSPLFTSAYFADDAQSADATGIAIGAAQIPSCGSGTNVVSFDWIEHDQNGNPTIQYHASYAIATVGAQKTLTRSYCRGSGTPDVATVAPVLGANGSCGRPACAFVDSPSLPRVLTLTATTPNNGSFTLKATRRAT